MKHAQKMILIPESEYHEISKTKDIKDKMKELLKGKHDYEAAKNMSQLVGEVIRRKQNKKKKSVPEINLLENFSSIYHNKVKTFVKHLNNNGITWNDELEVKHIPGSNIIDLIKEAIVRGKRRTLPIGWEQFIYTIASSKIPTSFFSKTATIDDLQRMRHEWQVY